MTSRQDGTHEGVSRRDFIRSSAFATGGVLAGGFAVPFVHGGGRSTMTVGVIGCGGRGTGAAFDCLAASEDVEIVALADMFPDRLASCRRELESSDHVNRERASVADDRCHTGFDAYKELLADGVDVVILATPPHFRPMHITAAIDRGCHVFSEKPVGVDPVGIRAVLEAGRAAKEKGLSFVAGTQRRHERCYLEALERVRDGAIGDLVSASCSWNQGGLWMHRPRPEWTDMEWQLRNWLYFTWLSGDHIVEQHVHNLDVCNWFFGEYPAYAVGMGGRQSRTAPEFGNIFDHFTCEFVYPSGAPMTSMCRQADGCDSRVDERIYGTKGTLFTRSGHAAITGENPWRFEGENPSPYVREHRDLHASIRSGSALNEAESVATSTLTAIMARVSAYTGKHLTWDRIMQSELDLSPEAYVLGPIGVRDVAIPGRTPLV